MRAECKGSSAVVIISEHAGFVFIKTRKTAGSSVEIALSRFCGPHDVLSGLYAREEELRSSQGYRGQQHDGVPVRQWRRREVVAALRSRRWPRLRPHTPASDVAKLLGPHRFENLMSFTIERNPYDRIVSLYDWRTRHASDVPSMSDFLRTEPLEHLSNWGMYATGGTVIVDRVLRYERLYEDLTTLCVDLGLDASYLVLPRAKSETRRSRDHYSERLLPEHRRTVERICGRELEYFGYEWSSG